AVAEGRGVAVVGEDRNLAEAGRYLPVFTFPGKWRNNGSMFQNMKEGIEFLSGRVELEALLADEVQRHAFAQRTRQSAREHQRRATNNPDVTVAGLDFALEIIKSQLSVLNLGASRQGAAYESPDAPHQRFVLEQIYYRVGVPGLPAHLREQANTIFNAYYDIAEAGGFTDDELRQGLARDLSRIKELDVSSVTDVNKVAFGVDSAVLAVREKDLEPAFTSETDGAVLNEIEQVLVSFYMEFAVPLKETLNQMSELNYLSTTDPTFRHADERAYFITILDQVTRMVRLLEQLRDNNLNRRFPALYASFNEANAVVRFNLLHQELTFEPEEGYTSEYMYRSLRRLLASLQEFQGIMSRFGDLVNQGVFKNVYQVGESGGNDPAAVDPVFIGPQIRYPGREVVAASAYYQKYGIDRTLAAQGITDWYKYKARHLMWREAIREAERQQDHQGKEALLKLRGLNIAMTHGILARDRRTNRVGIIWNNDASFDPIVGYFLAEHGFDILSANDITLYAADDQLLALGNDFGQVITTDKGFLDTEVEVVLTTESHTRFSPVDFVVFLNAEEAPTLEDILNVEGLSPLWPIRDDAIQRYRQAFNSLPSSNMSPVEQIHVEHFQS
ncbi:MAG: hypothetical protein K8I00_08255, partial [Candidatus Omnitrophica bacterium]|nr:hypothetical protein [Candidatus Omnitrophota bacterium]